MFVCAAYVRYTLKVFLSISFSTGQSSNILTTSQQQPLSMITLPRQRILSLYWADMTLVPPQCLMYFLQSLFLENILLVSMRMID